MKHLRLAALALGLALLLTACGGEDAAAPAAAAPASSAPATEESAATAEDAVSAGLQELSDDLQGLSDHLQTAEDVLSLLKEDHFWMACAGSDLYSLHLNRDGLTLTCYTAQNGPVETQTVTGTFALDADGLRVTDAEGQTLLDFDWTMAAEADALQRLDLEAVVAAADLPAGEALSFYETEVADADEADAMARSYLENRQAPDPAQDDLTTLLAGYRGVSIVDACILNGLDPSLENRAVYAEAFGIENYRGTAEQNLQLLTSMGGIIA